MYKRWFFLCFWLWITLYTVTARTKKFGKTKTKIGKEIFFGIFVSLSASLPKEKFTFNLMEKNLADFSELMGKYETLDDPSKIYDLSITPSRVPTFYTYFLFARSCPANMNIIADWRFRKLHTCWTTSGATIGTMRMNYPVCRSWECNCWWLFFAIYFLKLFVSLLSSAINNNSNGVTLNVH